MKDIYLQILCTNFFHLWNALTMLRSASTNIINILFAQRGDYTAKIRFWNWVWWALPDLSSVLLGHCTFPSHTAVRLMHTLLLLALQDTSPSLQLFVLCGDLIFFIGCAPVWINDLQKWKTLKLWMICIHHKPKQFMHTRPTQTKHRPNISLMLDHGHVLKPYHIVDQKTWPFLTVR